MSELDTETAAPARQHSVLSVRDAGPADYPAIRDVVIAAYRQYADVIMAVAFLRHLTGSRAHADGALPAHRIAARRCA